MDPLNDRSISLQNFINDRSVEIQHFTNLLKDKTCAKKVRLIPKNIRRRAMSHNRYRIPLRQRAAIEDDLKVIESMQKIPRCRKTIRKKHLLIRQYKKRESKVKWLGNHLWSAKRMKMIEYFGYKVGLNPNDKSDRACYRFSKYGCCLMNLSFYQILRINVKDVNRTQILLKFMESVPAKQSQFSETILFNQQGGMICPVIVYKNGLEYYVHYHPAARKEVQQLPFSEFEFETQIIENRMEIYRLMGPESIEKINLLLQNIGYESFPGSIAYQFKTNTNPNMYDKNLTLSIDIANCKYESKLILSPSKAITQYIKQDYQPTQQSMICENYSHAEEEPFWKEVLQQKQEQEGKFEFATRSKYTHRRKNKMSKQDKQKLMKENPLANITPKKQKEKIIEQKQQVIYEIKYPQKEKTTPQRRLLISLINNNRDTDGCLLMFSNFDFSYIWRKLTFLNCKLIGLIQYQSILNQNLEKVYPKDYPLTQGHKILTEKSVDQNIIRFRRKPPAKLPHYKAMCSPLPFGINISLFMSYTSLTAFKNFKCVSVGRGSIPSNSYVFHPTQQDIQKLKEFIDNKECISYVHKQQQVQIERMKSKQVIRLNNKELQEYFMLSKTDRQLIGFITSGGVNFKISKGYGIGMVRSDYDLPYVLVRKPTSPFYFMAQVQEEEQKFIKK